MEDKKLFLSLLNASKAHADRSREMFQEMGLTEGQPKILYILKRQDGYVQKELAQICGIKQSTLTVLLNKMEQQGYVYKDSCYISGGKRAYQIFLTKAGREKAEQLESVVEQLEAISFFGFSEEEKKAIFYLLEKIEKNMSQ